MPKLELTQSLADRPPPCPPGRSRIDYYDTLVTGLLLEVRSSGVGAYHRRYRDAAGRQCQVKLGDTTALTLTDARSLAETGRRQQAEKKARAGGLTFAAFAEERYMPYARVRKRSWQTDQWMLRGRLLPAWGGRPLSELTRADVASLHDGMRAEGLAPSTCNRYLALARFMLSQAVKWGVIERSPAQGVESFEENNLRNRYLTEEETGRLLEALGREQNRAVAAALHLLLLTGARRGEALGARWADVDLERRIWTVPLPKSGRARHIPLSAGAVELLRSLPRGGDEDLVFPSYKTGRQYNEIHHIWVRVRKAAGLGGMRVHDLRHSFASFLVSNQRSLYEVQALLGHADCKTTMRYAHLSPQALFQATGVVDALVARAAGGSAPPG